MRQTPTFDNAYSNYLPYQTRSYSLSRSLERKIKVLEFFTGYGTGLPSRSSVDRAMDGDVQDACQQYDASAGVNAATHDNEGQGRWNECHTLVSNEWCANL